MHHVSLSKGILYQHLHADHVNANTMNARDEIKAQFAPDAEQVVQHAVLVFVYIIISPNAAKGICVIVYRFVGFETENSVLPRTLTLPVARPVFCSMYSTSMVGTHA